MTEIRNITWLDFLTPIIKVEIEGIDVTDRIVFEEGLSIEWTLDFPSLTSFTVSSIRFALKNDNGEFDPGNADEETNFFLINDLPQHGHNLQVNIQMGFRYGEDDEDTEDVDESEHLIKVFTGIIDEISASLNDTKSQVLVLDAGSPYRNNEVTDFGNVMYVSLNEGEENEDGLYVSYGNKEITE